MHRVVLPLLAGCGALALAACGSSAAAGTTTPKPGTSPTPRAGARAFNGAAGQLVQIKGQTLIVSNAQGDTTVAYTSSTPITQTSTATFADITSGECISATGTKDTSGAITASNVTVRNATNGSCTAAGVFGPGGPGGGAGNGGATRTPNPNRTPNPSFSPPANLGRANGLVTAVNGTSVTVQETGATGTTSSTTITVPTTVQVSRIDTVDSSALQTGECLTALGQKDSSGTVQARTLTIVPAGPNGCAAGGGFGGGRFGGGGFPGGGFPGGGGGSGTGGTAA